MSVQKSAIDDMLAATLRGEPGDALEAALHADPALLLGRITYHGVAGLLQDTPGAMAGWPDAVTARVREEALAQAMWELRHRQLLGHLLGQLAAEKVIAVLLKGTALAYDLYAIPSARTRGDSDLLVDPADLATTRSILARLGFVRAAGMGARQSPYLLQEVWSRTSDRETAHHVDLHWQVLNSPALGGVLPVAECLAERVALPRLGPDAMAMDRMRSLIHACIHRQLNFTAPYIVDNKMFYGGDRLIWLADIDRIARALTEAELAKFTQLSTEQGVAATCLDGLLAAQRAFATPLASTVRDALAAASVPSQSAAYLRARQFGRSWRDLRAVSGTRRKIGYMLARILPSSGFIRDKYSRQSALPVALLYARRMVDLIRARPTEDSQR